MTVADTSPPVPGARPLLDAAAVRRADARSRDECGLPSILLMERAGLAAAEAILRRHPAAGAAAVVAGPGNNGGDGAVVARHLADAGWTVRLLLAGERPRTLDGTLMTAVAERCAIAIGELAAAAPAGPGEVVVDALLGTGTAGAPRGAIAEAVAWIGRAPGPVVSLDVPTGVDGDSGRVEGAAVRAGLTVSFHVAKPGLHVAPGRELAGEVVVAPIGIPGTVRETPAAWLVDEAALAALGRRAPAADKYAAGAVLVVAGAPGMIGAGILATASAMRAGAGLVVAAVPAALWPILAGTVPEAVGAPLDTDGGALGPPSRAGIDRQLGRVAAVALGPGLGRAEPTGDLVRALLAEARAPLVLDADGLWHATVAGLAARAAPLVVTPHAGEAARLLGWERARVEAERLASARELAAASGAVAVLKGPGTIVAAPDGRVAVDAVGGPELATAGSGDVLTGIVAAMLARGLEPWTAAVLAVVAHGAAGRDAGRGEGIVAGDLVGRLPEVLAAR